MPPPPTSFPQAPIPVKSNPRTPLRELYTQIKLEGKEIRVLDIDRNSPANVLRGRVRKVQLGYNHSSPFVALSYRWGPPSPTGELQLEFNHQTWTINVTTNAYDALKSLRNQLDSPTVWIDPVCINQNDGDEKASQIPLMKLIYNTAAAVYVAVQPSNEATDLAMDWMAEVSKPWRRGISLLGSGAREGATKSERKLFWREVAHILGMCPSISSGKADTLDRSHLLL
jgi:hypothetical protein